MGAGVFLVGLVSYWRSDRWALALFVVPGLVTLAGALAIRGTMYPRFFFSLIGFALLIAIRGTAVTATAAARVVHRGHGGPTAARRWVTAAVGVLIAGSAVSLRYNYRWPKQDFVGAADWVAANVPPGDAVVTAGVTVFPYREYLPQPWLPIPEGEEERVATLRAERRVWVVYVFPRYLAGSHPRLMRLIREDCGPEVRFHGTLGGGDIAVCPLPPTGTPALSSQPAGST